MSDVLNQYESNELEGDGVKETSEQLLANVESARESMNSISETNKTILEQSELLSNTANQLANSINEIHQFVNNINNISNQTNMLALNASIEAARTGAAGAGFAVVAKSMASLSADTKNAANQILTLLTDLDERVVEMQKAITNTSASQEAQSETTAKMLESIKEIESLTNELVK